MRQVRVHLTPAAPLPPDAAHDTRVHHIGRDVAYSAVRDGLAVYVDDREAVTDAELVNLLALTQAAAES